MSCGVGHRHGLDSMLLWLWCILAATALIRPLAWELPYATGTALEKKKYTYTYILGISWNQTVFVSPLLSPLPSPTYHISTFLNSVFSFLPPFQGR